MEKTNGKKIRRHRVLDKPILGYFLLILFALLAESVFGFVDNWIAKILPAYSTMSSYTIGGVEYTKTTASGVGTALGALLGLLLFKLWFRPDFKGCLHKDTLVKGLVFLASVALVHFAGSIVSICILGLGNVGIAFLRCLAPGFGEEVAFRGLGIANWMRRIKNEKQIVAVLWVPALVFGLIHISNAIAGAPLKLSIIQGIYASGIGLLFGAVYLRTGNLWPTIIAHSLIDFLEFCRADIFASGGVMTGLTAGDWITTVAGGLAAVLGIYLCRKDKRAEILEIWAQRWSRDTEQEGAVLPEEN